MAQALKSRVRWNLRMGPAAAVAFLFVLSGCGAGGPAYEPPLPDVAAITVMTTGLAFDPAEVKVRVGDTVEWRNKSLLTHTVTTDPTLARDKSHVRVPEGAQVFDSGAVFPGEVFRYTFKVPGIYLYICEPHQNFGMRGTVVVEMGE